MTTITERYIGLFGYEQFELAIKDARGDLKELPLPQLEFPINLTISMPGIYQFKINGKPFYQYTKSTGTSSIMEGTTFVPIKHTAVVKLSIEEVNDIIRKYINDSPNNQELLKTLYLNNEYINAVIDATKSTHEAPNKFCSKEIFRLVGMTYNPSIKQFQIN